VTTDERKTVGTIGVAWDDDFGVIDMSTGRVLMYGFTKRDPNISWYQDRVTVEDDDFAVLADDAADAIEEYANWDNLYWLLLHPKFDFADALTRYTGAPYVLSPTDPDADSEASP
jgi:hypothetical protein